MEALGAGGPAKGYLYITGGATSDFKGFIELAGGKNRAHRGDPHRGSN